MNKDTISRIFRDEYNGQRNFVTPNIVRYGKINGFAYELSSGNGFSGEKIYGVTVLELSERLNLVAARRSDLNRCFHSLRDAEYWIEQLSEDTEE